MLVLRHPFLKEFSCQLNVYPPEYQLVVALHQVRKTWQKVVLLQLLTGSTASDKWSLLCWLLWIYEFPCHARDQWGVKMIWSLINFGPHIPWGYSMIAELETNKNVLIWTRADCQLTVSAIACDSHTSQSIKVIWPLKRH